MGQFSVDARAAIRPFVLLVNGRDPRAQRGIFQSPRARFLPAFRPVVITTAGDFKGTAKLIDGVLAAHLVDAFVALFGGSERMPKVFFRISRCTRRRSFSRRKAAFSAAKSPGLEQTGRVRSLCLAQL